MHETNKHGQAIVIGMTLAVNGRRIVGLYRRPLIAFLVLGVSSLDVSFPDELGITKGCTLGESQTRVSALPNPL